MLLLWALFGLLGGAFAHRLADRTLEETRPGGWGWLPRCPRCGRPQGPLARLAVLAIPLRRACGGCGYTPGREQLAAELAGAGLVTLLGWRVGGVEGAIWALGTLVLVTVTLTDLRERLIPNAVTYPATALALLLSFIPGAMGPLAAGEGALAGLAVGLVMMAFGVLLFRRADAFGLGDVKLALAIGAFSGFPAVLTALFVAVFVNAAFSLAIVFARRSFKGTMPYGPALAIGAYLVWLLT